MTDRRYHYLFIEPYYGGSHQSFLSGLQAHLSCDFTLLTLPARKWKMRMQLAAPYMAEKIIAMVEEGQHFDGMLTSTFIDVAVLQALLNRRGISLPVGIYFHENQFAYPTRPQDTGRHQFTAINFTSALCADTLAFNSRYNLDTFLAGIARYLKKAADISLDGAVADIRAKSVVLAPGMDFTPIDALKNHGNQKKEPMIVWNHRWEHDKNPEAFFTALKQLSQQGLQFGLIVLGESFREIPEIFLLAKEQLAQHIHHFGYARDRQEYYTLLSQGTIAVSTAIHEFFGLAMLEAVRCGCIPLVPDRLSYKELFPTSYRYRADRFADKLATLITDNLHLDPLTSLELTEPYAWSNMSKKYEKWLGGLHRPGA